MKNIDNTALRGLIGTLLAICFFSALSACDPSGRAASHNSQPSALASSAISCTDQPLKVVMLVDLSSSIEHYGITLPTIDEIADIVDVIESCGGEIGVGPIKEDPTTPLVRLRLDPRKILTEPKREDFANAFDYAKALRPYREYVERRQSRVSEFLDDVDDLLDARGSAKGSDVHSGLHRVALFLGEDDSSWDTAPQKYGVLITDAVHNAAKSAYSTPPADVTYLVVAGRAGLGGLANLKPEPLEFESSSAAMRFIQSKGVQ